MASDFFVASHLAHLYWSSFYIGSKFWRAIQNVAERLPLYVACETDRSKKPYGTSDAPRESGSHRGCNQPIFIAPPSRLGGLALRNGEVIESDHIYHLSPELLALNEEEIQGTIAVQFADCMIRQREQLYWDRLRQGLVGMEPHGLAKRWGFQPPLLPMPRLDYVQHHDKLGNYTWGVGCESIMARESWIAREYEELLRRVVSRLAVEVVASIAPSAPIFVAPPPCFSGYVGSAPARAGQRPWIYLSPTILSGCAKNEAEATIAHELAHVYLKHPLTRQYGMDSNHKRAEAEADQLVKQWGFDADSSG